MESLAVSYDDAGRRDGALELREEVLALSRKVLGPEHPDTLMAMRNLAVSYVEAGRHQEAISLLAMACEVDPKDSDAALTLAAFQTWFGQDADYETTRHRVVQQAEGIDQARTAERCVRAACLRPSTDAALLAKTLELARRGVEFGKNSPLLPGYQMGLGLAEYRNAQYAAAEQTLAVAEQKAGGYPEIQGVARLFRAMSLFQQNRPEEARKLFSQAGSEIPPLPKDEGSPRVDGRTLSRDVLICWLAYKEAGSLLNELGPAKL